MERYLEETPLLDYRHPAVAALVDQRGWRDLARTDPGSAIEGVYDFVREELPFGYNAGDELSASRVLRDGYGQCNTKGVVLMALLRAVGVPCRIHGFTIDKRIQRGAVSGLAWWLAPRSIVHSWVEILFEDRWINLEGFIIDGAYLEGVRAMHPHVRGRFEGYAVATENLAAPPIRWCGRDTYIQRTGINHDFGVFDSPDEFFARHGSNLSGLRRVLYGGLIRHAMNRRVARVRRRSSSSSAAPAAAQRSFA
jgi:hypothetical protein